jgi:hypothetical protein
MVSKFQDPAGLKIQNRRLNQLNPGISTKFYFNLVSRSTIWQCGVFLKNHPLIL